MESSEICSMACTNGAAVTLPSPGEATPETLRFVEDGNRALYMVMIGNSVDRPVRGGQPKAALVGLSPASTQMEGFCQNYNRTGDYSAAALAGAFKGLEKDLANMMNGLGVSHHLGFGQLPHDVDLNRCGHFLTTSLVRCASLTFTGGSSDFEPWKYPSNVRCITERFVPEVLSEENLSLSHILILGAPAKKALKEKIFLQGLTAHDYIESHGKKILYLPHPSGANRESVQLASYTKELFPALGDYVESKWGDYTKKCRAQGKEAINEARYKRTRTSRWNAINEIRQVMSPA